MARKPTFIGMQARPGDKMIDGWPVTCSRTQFLEDKDVARQTEKEFSECRKINTRPGFEKLTKMKARG